MIGFVNTLTSMAELTNINSSYRKNNFGEIFDGMAFVVKPKLTVEVGVLEGYSAYHLSRHSEKLVLLDLFDLCTFKHAHFEDIQEKFPAADVRYFDFYKDPCPFSDIELLHIDIANTGETYRRFLTEWWPKLAPGGIALLEGGSEERDNYWWMKAFKKTPISQALIDFRAAGVSYHVIEAFPSLTIVRK